MPNLQVHGCHSPMKLEKSQVVMCNLPVGKTVLESAPAWETRFVDEVRGRERNTTTTTTETLGKMGDHRAFEKKGGLCDEGGEG